MQCTVYRNVVFDDVTENYYVRISKGGKRTTYGIYQHKDKAIKCSDRINEELQNKAAKVNRFPLRIAKMINYLKGVPDHLFSHCYNINSLILTNKVNTYEEALVAGLPFDIPTLILLKEFRRERWNPNIENYQLPYSYLFTWFGCRQNPDQRKIVSDMCYLGKGSDTRGFYESEILIPYFTVRDITKQDTLERLELFLGSYCKK